MSHSHSLRKHSRRNRRTVTGSIKKLLMIVNPCAGKQHTNDALYCAVRNYSKAGYLVLVRETREAGDATLFASTAGADFDVVVCYGGDGTLNETISGLMKLPSVCRPMLGYLPGGSTNDFAASLEIPLDPAAASAHILRPNVFPLDIGLFNDHYFVYVASFGAFTRTSYSTPQDAKNWLGHFAYLLEGAKNLDTVKPYHMKVNADGDVYEGSFYFGAVGNTTSIAGMLKFPSEDVEFNDGRFELLLIPVPTNVSEQQSLLLTLLSQNYEESQSVIFRHVKHLTVDVEDEEEIPWTLDGEYNPGTSHIDISIQQKGIHMLL